jgi:hypothetical protein
MLVTVRSLRYIYDIQTFREPSLPKFVRKRARTTYWRCAVNIRLSQTTTKTMCDLYSSGGIASSVVLKFQLVILVNNQLGALFFDILVFIYFTSLHVSRWLPGMPVCLLCRSGSSFLSGIPGSHLHRVIYTRWCINTIHFSWRWALGCSKHVEKWNK